MSEFQFAGQGPNPFYQKITSNAATTVTALDGSGTSGQKIVCPYLEVNEINGGTQNLTVEVYDGTNSYYLGSIGLSAWKAKAVTAKQSVQFENVIIPKGSKLRITSSDASGYFDVRGIIATQT